MRLATLVLTIIFLPWLAPAQIELSDEQPTQGEAVTINLEKPESMLVVTYRPNSSVARRDTLRAAQPAAAFQWTPRKAGVVSLSTASASRNVSVRFQGLSASGLLVMIVAGTLLFGGAAFAFRVLFRDEEEDETLDIELDHFPDT
ncbi:MAG: hypothetical protein KDD10_18525 [Phaeodactylibacter sp.]|nr:hypothetical protein [Phaeodactylibacter sp.]MCB9297047.1 hypothetical protein [Lewinellaceae bacterium]